MSTDNTFYADKDPLLPVFVCLQLLWLVALVYMYAVNEIEQVGSVVITWQGSCCQ